MMNWINRLFDPGPSPEQNQALADEINASLAESAAEEEAERIRLLKGYAYKEYNFVAEDEETARHTTNPDYPGCCFHEFVGNKEAMSRISKIAYKAWMTDNHCMPYNIALLGPASAGKTTLARLLAENVSIPYAEIGPTEVQTCHELLHRMDKADGFGPGYDICQVTPGIHKCPPMIVFLDEIHAFSKNIIAGLLKATERNDAMLHTEEGLHCDCSNVTWIIGTTERGQLFDAFDSRFIKIQLNLYTKEEIATMIFRKKEGVWEMPFCRKIASYAGILPREVFQFVQEMETEQNFSDCSWEHALEQVRISNKIDQFGMSHQRVKILKALNQRPCSKNTLATVAGCKTEELLKYVLPAMLAETPEREALVMITNKYEITPAGIEELKKRKLA